MAFFRFLQGSLGSFGILNLCCSRRMSDEEAKQMLDRRIGLLLSVPLYTSTLRACFLQTAFSVEMLRHRCPVKVFGIMNGLGISQSKTTAGVHAKKLAEEHGRQVKQWRDEIQNGSSC